MSDEHKSSLLSASYGDQSDELQRFFDSILVENNSLKIALANSKATLSELIDRTTVSSRQLKSIADQLSESIPQDFSNTLHVTAVQLNHLIHKWQHFKTRFEETYPAFVNGLAEKGIALTAEDLQLCYVLKLNLDESSAANQLGLTAIEFDQRRALLRAKLNINKSDTLTDFLSTDNESKNSKNNEENNA